MFGRIVRIKLKGFMTYDDLEIIPVKGLNLILGLNGCGKSSIMCAICMGLGGKPQYTGRSVQLSDFIKFNHTKAIVEIELESPNNKNDVICRVIQADKQQSWYLNDVPVNQSEISSLVQKYNIDMGNLCQFLPQEKVAEFSKMDKKQRLVNMIRSIGDPNLVTLFDELKALRMNYIQLGKDLDELEDSKALEEKSNERLKPEIEKQEERMQLENNLKLLKYERMFCLYEELKSKVHNKEAEIKEHNKEILEIEKQYNGLEAEKETHSSEFRHYRTKIDELKGQIAKHMQNLTKCYEKLRVYHEEVDNAKIYFRNRMEAKEGQMKHLDTLRKQIKVLKDVLVQKKDDLIVLKEKLDQYAKNYDVLKQQLSSCDTEMERIKLSKNSLEYKRKFKQEEIQKISNEEDKNYEVLRYQYPEAYTALQWLQQNESSFKSRISYPPLVSIKVKSNEYSKFIENTVSVRDLLMFVCEDKGDLERFVNIMKNEKKLQINASMVPDETLADFPSQRITDNMRSFGIQCYLKDLFTAPDPVMRYLCKLYKVHKVPMCSEKAEANIEMVLQYNAVFFTTTVKFYGKRSQYGQKSLSVKRDEVMRRNILPNIKDNSSILLAAKNELQEIEQSLEEYKSKYSIHENRRTELERQQEQLRKEKNDVNTEVRKLNELKDKLAQFSDNYKKKERDIVNEAEEKKKVTDAVCTLNARKLEMILEMNKITKDILHSKKEKVLSILYLKSFVEKISSLEEKISALRGELSSKKSVVFNIQKAKSYIKSQAKDLLKEIYAAKESAGPEFSVVMASASHSSTEIEQQISSIEAQLELIHGDIAPIMMEFQRREKAIKDIGGQVTSLKKQIEELKIKIQERKQKWLPELKFHIGSVNKKFSKYYKILKCAGEISLDQTDDTDDFPNYGLQIKLKYRVDEEFMELSQTHHSGGECSVAAIIFILSLQELTDVPFRCIDEINQGMDAVNERKIYQLVADAAKSGSCSQYFLLTPKLLMDLSYHKDVAVHTIFNSPFLQSKLDVKQHLKIAKALKQ